jgi:outer membrane protein OmpA-like peptidoglycan-associated protein
MAQPFLAEAQVVKTAIIHFDFDRYVITHHAKSTLDSILQIKDILSKKIELYGHCDSLGDHVYNDELSNRRVNAAKKYLLSHGMQEQNIELFKGFGKRKPLNHNESAEQRKKNRRVEILIKEPFVSLEKKIRDTSTKPGTNIILKNLNFIGNRHVLLKESWPILLDLLRALRNNPTLEIEIHGHVCCTGGKEGYDEDDKALILSTNRAVFVYKYLIDNGISKGRLSWKAFGNSKPLYKLEDTPEKRMQNMRVEIKIVKK